MIKFKFEMGSKVFFKHGFGTIKKGIIIRREYAHNEIKGKKTQIHVQYGISIGKGKTGLWSENELFFSEKEIKEKMISNINKMKVLK